MKDTASFLVQGLGRCQLCGARHRLVSEQLGVCLMCIRSKPQEALRITERVHENSRKAFALPPKPPNELDGLICGMCVNNCRIGVGGKGFCGLVLNIDGSLVRIGGTVDKGILEWYYDPLPTNCVAWWFCPGCTGAGYPEYSNRPTAEQGYSNLAVFYGSCSYDCLFCQNWHYRDLAKKAQRCLSAEGLAEKATSHVSCICYFGGDPSVQMPHALKTSELALRKAQQEKRILRICWETNGYEKKEYAIRAAELSLSSGGNMKVDLKAWALSAAALTPSSGGNMKVDLKAWDDNLNIALCGVPNKPTFETFRFLGERFFNQRPELPVLTASTLLVPGYVDAKEVEDIAAFVSEVNPQIPYTLLAFCPQYLMSDLPATSRTLARDCYDAAKRHLETVRIGNVNLLS